jgi:hypothetical protein
MVDDLAAVDFCIDICVTSDKFLLPIAFETQSVAMLLRCGRCLAAPPVHSERTWCCCHFYRCCCYDALAVGTVNTGPDGGVLKLRFVIHALFLVIYHILFVASSLRLLSCIEIVVILRFPTMCCRGVVGPLQPPTGQSRVRSPAPAHQLVI